MRHDGDHNCPSLYAEYYWLMHVEGVLLTGGASRRMGSDKSRLVIDGEVLSSRIARGLQPHCSKVTVLGRQPIEGYDFLPDEETFAGPAIALSRFVPTLPIVFVTSCDLPWFDGRLVPFFVERLQQSQACIPMHDHRLQPLCAAYRREAWSALSQLTEAGERSVMAWLDQIAVHRVDPTEISAAGIDPRAIRGANTPEELAQLLAEQ
jgi:molybdopterin-guanine dinucleotide biosynthesis protein A